MNYKVAQRMEWVDIYKAIGIVLVVIGHTTGTFNFFIYQFHMAAFFVISDYTTNLKKIPFFIIYIKRYILFYCLLLQLQF